MFRGSKWSAILMCAAICLGTAPGGSVWGQPATPEDTAPQDTAPEDAVPREDDEPNAQPEPPRSPAEREEAIRQALQKETQLEFFDTPLSEVLEFIAQMHGIPIILDEAALAEAGHASDEPVDRIVSGITLRSALKIILEPFGMTHVVQNEVLKVTSKERADRMMEIRVYIVSHLVERGDSAEDLARVIRATVRPESWRPPTLAEWFGAVPGAQAEGMPERAGAAVVTARPRPQASVEALKHRLVVSQTAEGHEQIDALLRALDEGGEAAQEPPDVSPALTP